MGNPATVADIETRWRLLSDQETTNATAFLGDAWVMLKRQMTRLGVDIDTEIAGDADLSADTARVIATAVIRVLKNPDGKKSEKVDDYSYDLVDDAAAGELMFTDAELDSLIPGSGEKGRVFMVDPLADYETRMQA